MFPYLMVWDMKLYMTGIGILLGFLTFLVFVAYFCKRYKQNFWRFFHWIPLFVALTYILGAYVNFVFQLGLFPGSYEELLILLSPRGFNFHFVGLLLWVVISIWIFLKKIKRYETKKVWVDIFFFSFAMALVPLGFFLLLGDNFIGETTSGLLWVRSLHTDSQLNKFSGVLPIGLFLSFVSLLSALIVWLFRRVKRKYGLGLLGFAFLLLLINIIFLFQQYPKHGIVSVWSVILDIKHHISFLVIMFCIWVYYKWKRMS